MALGIATVRKQRFVRATGVEQGVVQNRHAVEDAVIGDQLGKGNDLTSDPRGVERYGAEGIAEDVSDKVRLGYAFVVVIYLSGIMPDGASGFGHDVPRERPSGSCSDRMHDARTNTRGRIMIGSPDEIIDEIIMQVSCESHRSVTG